MNGGMILEKFKCLGDGHFQNIGYAFAFVMDRESFLVVASPTASITLDEDVR